jgi:hypothetical protein
MKRFVDLGSECVEYLKVAKASEGKSCFFFYFYSSLSLHGCLYFLARLFLSSLLNPGALKAAHARIASLEAELKASRTAFDAATAAKVNAEKSSKSALAKVKKAEKDLSIAKKEHLQREQAVAERLN